MYLKSLAELGGERTPVPVARLAARLGVSAVSAGEMLKRLADERLVERRPYKGVLLTDAGGRLANGVIRRQRLWECFLVERLGLDWATSVDLACDLEHATAPEVSRSLARFLGYPSACPHGNPIPDEDGRAAPPAGATLASMPAGAVARIAQVLPESSQVLAYLQARGIRPGQPVRVLEAAPLGGPLTIQVGAAEVALGLALAELVLVETADPGEWD
jgi:DtxR family Mn-dependent transcriptional regulator